MQSLSSNIDRDFISSKTTVVPDFEQFFKDFVYIKRCFDFLLPRKMT